MTIYNPSGGIIIDAPVSKEAIIKFVLMGDYYISLPVNSLTALDIPEGSYVLYKGDKYEIMSPVYPESSGQGYKYNLKFEHQQNKMKKVICFWLEGSNPEVVFHNTTSLEYFGNLIVQNMNKELGGSTWQFGGLVGVDNPETVKVVSFEGDTCWNAVNNIAKTFDCEWWTQQNGGIISLYFGKLEFGSNEIFKKGYVISDIPPRNSNNNDGYGTRFYVFGSTRNLTSDYGQAEQGGVTNHVSEIRLRLPDGQQYIDARPDLTQGEITPVVVFFDDIYPKNTDTVTSVEEKTITPDEGDPYPAYVIYAGETPFVPSDVVEGEDLQATFTSGDLTGLTFDVSINYDPKTWKPEDGFDKKFEVVAQIETSGDSVSIIPNANMKPKAGDTFILTGVKLPEARISEAEEELLAAGEEYASKHSGDTTVYDCPTNPVYCAFNEKNYDAGQVVILQDPRFGPEGRKSRIQGFEKKLYNEYIATYTVGDNRTYSRTGKIENDVKANLYAQRIGVTTSGAAIYVITRYDGTAATDYNVFSATRSLWEFANKQIDETFKGNVSFEKNITVRKNVSVGGNIVSSNFRQGGFAGSGYSIYEDENGDSVAEIDKLVVRKESQFNEAVINQVTFKIGATVHSNGGCEITSVEELDTAYRCYFDNKNGTRYSGLVVDDQVRCQRYDANQNNIVKYYWRLVVAVSENYVDLSKTDVDGSSIPEAGDEIPQFGNRTDKTRQSAIVINPQNGGSIEVYAHIDSYQLSGKNYVGMGVNPNTGEAYMYAYGDIFYGNRDISEEDFITFQKAEGDTKRKLRISADVQIGAGSSGLTNLSEWAEKQQQIDNAQTTADEAKDAVDNIKIGGVNLIDQSEYFKGQNNGGKWIIQGGSNAPVFEEYQGYMSMVCKTNGAPFSYPGAYLPVEIDTTQQYISTCYVFATEVGTIRCGLENGTSKSMIISISADQVGKWVRIENIQTSTTASNNFQVGVQVSSETLVVAFRMGQLETGNKATSWKESENDRQEKIDAAQTAAEAAQQSADNAAAGVDALKNFTDDAFADGVINRAEAAAIEKYTNSVTETKDAVDAAYETVYNNTLLAGTAKSNLQAAKSTFDTAVADLLASIQTASVDGIATPEEKSNVDAKYSAFNIAYSAFSTRIEEANKYIQTAINTTAEGAYQLSQQLQNAVDNLNSVIIPDLQDQIDKQIVSYNGTDIPTLDNYPANEWTDDTERARHVNDYYDRKITDEDGEVSYERYKFAYENSVYQWVRIADSGAAEAQAKALEALGVANGKNKVYFGDSTPAVPYIINDLWIKTSGDIYISNADRAEGATGSAADWQLVNDAQLRLRQMSSDSVISKEEKATLRNRLAQMQKEYASYQSDATTYGVSISALQTAYTNLTTFLTGTVAVNNDTDTTLTEDQRTAYNTYFAAYDAEVSRFTNLVADAIAQGKVDDIEVGGVNLLDDSEYFESTASGGAWYLQGGTGQPVYEEYQGYMSLVCKNNGAPFGYPGAGLNISTKIELGSVYVSSVFVWITEPCMIRCGIEVAGGDTTYISLTEEYVGKWVRIVAKQTPLQASNNFLIGVHSPSDTLIAAFRMGQLEEGNKVTSWSKSQNDIKREINDVNSGIQYLKDAFADQTTEISNGVVLTGAVVTREGDKIRAGVTNGQDNLPFIMADVQDDQDFQNAGYALFKNGVVRLSDQMQYMLQAPGEGLEFGLLQNGTAKRSMGITPQQFQMASGDNPFQSLLNVTGSKGSRVLTNISVYSDQVKMLSYPVVEYLLTNLPIHGIEAATNVVQVPAIQIVAEVSGNDNIASLDVEIAFKNRQSGTLVPIYQVYGQQSGRGVPVYVFYDGGTFNLVTGNYDIVLTATISCFNGMAGNNYEYSLTSSATGLLTYETESGEVRSDIYGNGYIFGKSPSQYIGFFNNEARTVFQIRCGNVGFMVSEAGIRKWNSSTNTWINL